MYIDLDNYLYYRRYLNGNKKYHDKLPTLNSIDHLKIQIKHLIF